MKRIIETINHTKLDQNFEEYITKYCFFRLWNNCSKFTHKNANTHFTYFFSHLISPPIWETFSLNFLFVFVSLTDFLSP